MGFSYYWSPERQRRWSEEKLLRYVRSHILTYHPYYRNKCREMGIGAGDLRSYEDFRKFPLVTKADLVKDHLAFILQPAFPGRKPLYENIAPIRKTELLKYACRAVRQPLPPGATGEDRTLRKRIEVHARREWFPIHFHASGGTTGNPSPAVYTHHDIFNVTPNIVVMSSWCGLKADQKMLNLFPAAPHLAFFQVVFSQFLMAGNVFHTCGGSVIPTERQIQICENLGFDNVVAIPSYLTYWLEVAEKMRKRGEIKKIDTIKCAVVSGEPMVPAYRDRIKSQFAAIGSDNVKIIEGYGMTELKGAFYECGEGSGIHLNPEHYFWEVLDPETKEPVPDGHEGVLTFSHIDFRGTVLIRFYTGDLIKGMVWDKCEHCGHTGPRLLTPLCRAVKDFTKIKGARVNLLNLQTAIRSTPGVESFHIVITKEKTGDPFSRDWVRVHVAKKADAAEEAIAPAMKKNVKLDCEISPSEIVFNTAEEIERMLFARTNLKADWIVDERQVHV